ncbi:hypothetical protein [Paraburkholderia panacisoli]|nr:hypothetical protein [Paraburkholderia panacisoli]
MNSHFNRFVENKIRISRLDKVYAHKRGRKRNGGEIKAGLAE